jgi:polysaccharide biosynthesis/export protein ExoF
MTGIQTSRQCRGGIAAILSMVLSGLLLSLSAGAAKADEYFLDAQDKLKIRVSEWQTIEGTFRDWSAVTGDYTVGPTGTLSLPFIGETQAAGKTTAEIAATIGTSLQQKFGLSDKPEASVELAEFRPFFIAGEVQSPGQYPYAPGLTVLKAVSIAGGVRRGVEFQRLERDIITARGSLEVLTDERMRLLVKKARIDAQLVNKTKFDVPSEVASAPNLPAVVADEMAIMTSEQKRLSLRLEALRDLKNLLEREIDSLEKKGATQKRQVDLAKQELEGIGALAGKGLVVSTRVLGAERTIADMEGQILDLETAILRAKQDISKATQDAVDLENTANSDLASERQTVEAALQEATLKVRMQNGLISEAMTLGPALAPGDEESISYALVRNKGGKTSEIEAGEATLVLPGDVIKVKRTGLAVQ